MKRAMSRWRGAARSPRSCSTACATRPIRNRSAAWSTSATARRCASSASFATARCCARRPRRRGARPKTWRVRPWPATSNARSARRPIITPTMSRRAGRRCCRKWPSSARISSIAGRGRGACPPPSPAATSASLMIRHRCGRTCSLAVASNGRWRGGDRRRAADRTRRKRRRRPARHVEGLDAQHPAAVGCEQRRGEDHRRAAGAPGRPSPPKRRPQRARPPIVVAAR